MDASKCTECNGRGFFQFPMSSPTCERCGGTGKATDPAGAGGLERLFEMFGIRDGRWGAWHRILGDRLGDPCAYDGPKRMVKYGDHWHPCESVIYIPLPQYMRQNIHDIRSGDMVWKFNPPGFCGIVGDVPYFIITAGSDFADGKLQVSPPMLYGVTAQ